LIDNGALEFTGKGDAMNIKNVGVVGCGLMGSGIVETCARSGYEVIVREVTRGLLKKGRQRIKGSMTRGVEKGKLSSEEMNAAWSRIRGTCALDDLQASDLVIEAVTENMAEKKVIFATMDKLCDPDVILASNTSSMCITEMGAVTKRPDRVLGMHFFNPVPVMPLLELVRTIQTSDETLQTAKDFGATLQKTIVVAKDTPGFIVNLLLVPYLLGAVRALENGLATKEDIDTAMKLGLNHPMGPLTLMDFVGVDTAYYIANVMYEEFREPQYAPPPLLKRMVLAGHLGRKTGKGFYDYK
jgi:3-hydroxybutyryl-CoA dehydrogenase